MSSCRPSPGVALRPSRRLKDALSAVALFSVGASAASNFSDYELTRSVRARNADAADYFAGALPAGALVISLDETALIAAKIKGVNLYHPNAGKPAEIAALIRGFDAAGRCVYARQGEIAAFAERAAGVAFVKAAAAPPENYDWFATISPVRPGCALS